MAQLNPEEIPSINIWDTSAVVLPSEPERLMKPEFRSNYENLISFSGLKLHQEVSYRDVEIERGVFVHEIYTIPPKGKNLPHILYIHGYGGTAMNSYRLLKHLHKNYQVHAIDRLGEGFSSLSNFSESFTYDENRAYFLRGIEGWRKKMKI